jgi:hypothetical protein
MKNIMKQRLSRDGHSDESPKTHLFKASGVRFLMISRVNERGVLRQCAGEIDESGSGRRRAGDSKGSHRDSEGSKHGMAEDRSGTRDSLEGAHP